MNYQKAVSLFGEPGFVMKNENRIIVMQKPVYGYTIAKVLNGEKDVSSFSKNTENMALNLEGVRALIVDDEPMNLIVATGLFKDYKMVVDTADSAHCYRTYSQCCQRRKRDVPQGRI